MVNGCLSCLNAEPAPDDPPALPPGVLFLCDFGCAMWAPLDCRHPEGQTCWWEEGDRHTLDPAVTDPMAFPLSGHRQMRHQPGPLLMR